MTIGMGDATLTIAAVPLAPIVDADVPSIPISVVAPTSESLREVDSPDHYTTACPWEAAVAALGNRRILCQPVPLNPFMVCA